MALKKQLRVKILGNGEDIEALVTLSGDDIAGWRAEVVAEWRGKQLTHDTPRLDRERDALQVAAVWMRSHFKARTTCLGAVCMITADKDAA